MACYLDPKTQRHILTSRTNMHYNHIFFQAYGNLTARATNHVSAQRYSSSICSKAAMPFFSKSSVSNTMVASSVADSVALALLLMR